MYSFLAVKTHQNRIAKKMKKMSNEIMGYISIPEMLSI
jgi:hypothetical protein